MRIVMAAVVLVAGCGWASAQHAGDVILQVQSGVITTHTWDGAIAADERVFVSILGTSFAAFASDPGFDCVAGTFPYPSKNGFDFLRAMRKWDGAAFIDVPPERIQVEYGPLGPVLTPMDDEVVTGFAIAVGANGEWHRHLEYTLLDPASDGLYVMEMRIWSQAEGIGPSPSFWLVFNQNASVSEQAAAVAWVRRHLVCPADYNGDGFVDIYDFTEFVTCFEGGECPQGMSGDFNNDGFADVYDFTDFVSAFETGC